ncbi:alpha-glucosidase [Chitinispirillum alkaliphilum]|nr:alpha-glucosidase [Chitinispirillum alkaliphilum]
MKFYKSADGVIKLSLGNPFPTGAVLYQDFKREDISIPYKSLSVTKGVTKILFSLAEEDVIFGLGQNVRGMNKRGFRYESFCSDEPNHTPDKSSLYGAHDFFTVLGKKTWGLYIDFPGKITYDLGYKWSDILEITIENENFNCYYFEGGIKNIITCFRKLIGRNYVPPKWAFGYQQSRWSYPNADAINNLVQRFGEHDLPCDVVYLDIDYMDNFKDFTISSERFPEFEPLIEALKNRGIKLIPIMDAGVKIEPGYEVYEEGVENGYFCTDESGSPFVGAVWPGKVHFPDFLQEKVRLWFGKKFHSLLKSGIEGFWIDMNEPAIFYSQQGLKHLFDFFKEIEGREIDVYAYFKLKDSIYHLSNSARDYKSIYHQADGKKINHYDVHNIYGHNMTCSAVQGFQTYDANKRFLILTRASHVATVRYSGLWTGDNHAWWEHLKLGIQMIPSLNMIGFLYSGSDTGGFQGHADAELITRWFQFSMFTPLFRNHSALGTLSQEPWAFGGKTLQRLKNTLRLRYALVPFLYSEFMKATLSYDMLFSHLAINYGLDPHVLRIEDQLLFGESLMLTPLYEQNSRGRHVYLPEKMVLWKMKSYESVSKEQFEPLAAGHHYIDIDIDQIPVFIRPDKMIVLVAPKNRVSELDHSRLLVIACIENSARYTLYNDDGVSNDYQKGVSVKTEIDIINTGKEYRFSVDTSDHELKEVEFILLDGSGEYSTEIMTF